MPSNYAYNGSPAKAYCPICGKQEAFSKTRDTFFQCGACDSEFRLLITKASTHMLVQEYLEVTGLDKYPEVKQE